MDIALAIFSAISLACSLATFGYLLATRHHWRDDLKARDSLKLEFLGALHKFSDEHNKLVRQIADTTDRMSALELNRAGLGSIAGKRSQ